MVIACNVCAFPSIDSKVGQRLWSVVGVSEVVEAARMTTVPAEPSVCESIPRSGQASLIIPVITELVDIDRQRIIRQRVSRYPCVARTAVPSVFPSEWLFGFVDMVCSFFRCGLDIVEFGKRFKSILKGIEIIETGQIQRWSLLSADSRSVICSVLGYIQVCLRVDFPPTRQIFFSAH